MPGDVAKMEIDRISQEIEAESALMHRADDGSDPKGLIQFAHDFLTDLSAHWQMLGLQKNKNFLKLVFPQGVLF